MNIKKQKGFTIIELIVVIAIIAILASIVLVNVTQYINKAKDAAIKSDMSNIAVGMATCGASANGSYTGCDSNTSYVQANLKTDIANQYASSAFTATYSSPATAYSAYVKLNDGSYVCIDSTGQTTNVHTSWTAPTAGAACPASN